MDYTKLRDIDELLDANSRPNPQLGVLEFIYEGNGTGVKLKKQRGEPIYPNEFPGMIYELLLTIKEFKDKYGVVVVVSELNQTPNILGAIQEAEKIEELEEILDSAA